MCNARSQGLVLAAYKLSKLESLVEKDMENCLNYGLIWAYKDSTVRIYKIECRGLDSKGKLFGDIYFCSYDDNYSDFYNTSPKQRLNPRRGPSKEAEGLQK